MEFKPFMLYINNHQIMIYAKQKNGIIITERIVVSNQKFIILLVNFYKQNKVICHFLHTSVH